MTDLDAEFADELLMARLSAIAAAVDAPPEAVDEAARRALSTRRIDAELAELLMDSAVDALTSARSVGDEVRLLSFATERVSIELQVEPVDEATVSVRGLVVGLVGEVVVETRAGSRAVAIDAAGWFTVEAVPRQAVRLTAVEPGGEQVVTSWATL